MALGGLGAVLLAGHPTFSLDHVLSKVDFRSVFFAVIIVIIVLVLAYLTNPTEASFRGHLTELHIKQHLRQVDEGVHDDSFSSDDPGVRFTLSRRPSPNTRKAGGNFDPTSPFHFINRASVSLRTPKHVYHSFGIVAIAAVYPTSRYSTRGNGHAIQSEDLASPAFHAWYVGAFGRWFKGGIVQSWWHEMLESTKDAESCGSGLLDVKALDLLEGFDGFSFSMSSRPPSDANVKLRGTERSTQRLASNVPRSVTPPPLPKSASLPLHAPRVPASSPPKMHGTSNQRHAPSPAQSSAPVTPEQSRASAPPMIAYSPSSTSLWDSSPIIAEVLRQISQSRAAVQELRTQLTDFRTVSSESHATIQGELQTQRERKREEDGARAELKSRTKTLEDSKRSVESSKRDAEKRLRAAENARDNAAARIERLGEEIGVLRSRMRDDDEAAISCKEEGDVKEKETRDMLEHKRKEIKVAEEVVAALNARAKELEERVAQEGERLHRAKEQAEIKKQDRSFYPLTVVPTVNEEDIAIPPWSPYANQTQDPTQGAITHQSTEAAEHQELFPQPIQARRSKGSASSGSGDGDNRDVSISPRPARLSLTGISNLREPANRVLPEPDPNGQVLLRPRGFPLFNSDLPSTLSTQSTSTRFSPFGDSDDAAEGDVPASVDPPSSSTSLSPSSFIPSSLISSLDGAGGFDNVGLSRSFQSEDDAVLSRGWRKAAPFPPPHPVENPGTGMGICTTSPVSLTCPTFDGEDSEDPFEVRLPSHRRRFTSELMDMQRVTLLPTRTISDPPLPPVGLTDAAHEPEWLDKTSLAHRRWSSQQDAGKEKKGLNPEAKAFSLTKKSFTSLFSAPQQQPHHGSAFDPLALVAPGAHLSTSTSGSLSTLAASSSSLATHPSLGIEDGHNLFSSLSMRAFAPSPAEREALQRALGGSTNTSLERLPSLSEVSSVSSIPSLSLPSSPSHIHAHAHPAPPGLGPTTGLLGAGVGSSKDVGIRVMGAAGFGFGGLSWLQSLPRVRKPKFSPWEDEEVKELEAGGGE